MLHLPLSLFQFFNSKNTTVFFLATQMEHDQYSYFCRGPAPVGPILVTGLNCRMKFPSVPVDVSQLFGRLLSLTFDKFMNPASGQICKKQIPHSPNIMHVSEV